MKKVSNGIKIKGIFSMLMLFACFEAISTEKDTRLVSELTIAELQQTVRQIVEESIEQCLVKGTMEGRAKLNLAVEGEVLAKMECNFSEDQNIISTEIK